jgi:ribosome-associated protein
MSEKEKNKQKKSTIDVLNIIAQSIYDKKGANILAIDVRGMSSLCDNVIIAEGMHPKHNIAIANNIVKELSKHDIKPFYHEGMSLGDWVVLDFFDILVHLFTAEERVKYSIENLYREGNIVDLKIIESSLVEPVFVESRFVENN